MWKLNIYFLSGKINFSLIQQFSKEINISQRNPSSLDIKSHYKPTKTFQYVHFTSFHPSGVKRSFIKGEEIRLIRKNSSKKTFEECLVNSKHTKSRASDRVRQKMGNSAAFSREIMRQERSIMRQIMRFF